tara:strand:- start:663 stop:941 length:279 start_codon:yes stop_codon:yes gene_type:complete
MSWEDILKQSPFQNKLIEFVNSHRDEMYSLVTFTPEELTHHLNFIEDTYSDRKAFNAWLKVVDSIKQKGNNPTWLLEPENWNIPDRWLKGRN